MNHSQNPSQQINYLQDQKLQLTPQMTQSIQILQYSTPELTEYLNSKALENPFLKFIEHDSTSTDLPLLDNVLTKRETRSLVDYLHDQVTLTMRETTLRAIVLFLISRLDESGYLRDSDDIRAQLTAQGIPAIQLEDALTLLQQLDPPGVGARSLQECLTLQIDRLIAENDTVTLQKARSMIVDHFTAFKNNRYQQLKEKLGMSSEEYAAAMQTIKQLDPSPGQLTLYQPPVYIIPDVEIVKTKGRTVVRLTKYGYREIKIDNDSLQNLQTGATPEVEKYIQEKLHEVRDLEDAIERRRETLLAISTLIVRNQRDFFLNNGPLKPLLLREIAAPLRLNVSTVSRAIHGKYIRSPRGTIAMRDIFQSRSSSPTANEALLPDIQQQIKQKIAEEDPTKPLSDQALADMLSTKDKTYSRRVITKYRQQLNIPSTRERRR